MFLSSGLLMVKRALLLAACWMVILTVLSMYVYVCVPFTQWLMRLTSHTTQKTTQVSMTTPALLFLHTHSLLMHTAGLLNNCLFFFYVEIIFSYCFIVVYFPRPVWHHSHKLIKNSQTLIKISAPIKTGYSIYTLNCSEPEITCVFYWYLCK